MKFMYVVKTDMTLSVLDVTFKRCISMYMYMYMCMCVRACVYVCICVYVYVYIYICICVYVYVFVYMYMFMYILSVLLYLSFHLSPCLFLSHVQLKDVWGVGFNLNKLKYVAYLLCL